MASSLAGPPHFYHDFTEPASYNPNFGNTSLLNTSLMGGGPFGYGATMGNGPQLAAGLQMFCMPQVSQTQTVPMTPPGSPDDKRPRSPTLVKPVPVPAPHPRTAPPAALVPSFNTSAPPFDSHSFPNSFAASSSPAVACALAAAQTAKRQRGEKKSVPDDAKDIKYFERRKRNNLAAKKSRDSRKSREDEIAIRASFLEKENAILRAQVATLREEATSLRQLLLQKRAMQCRR